MRQRPSRKERVSFGDVIVGKHFYLMSEPGLAQCFELETSKELWDRKRLGDRS